ncbi:protein-methionine-sulfoxide reductase heme-binding subunit MsrQ [Thalassococcus lentus]|uniref:Ferric reductase-like transmembrane domain-containing protein n=1 Tax=Thalassococcus lentus TaxID=1210524 RepID=A0ABT4XPU8_9RHOB|nr:ferric reductase-like transmembrane domain-containing protein [Thalassococcus lentus]MDA7423935.1 ferric reductase-like transmembrane domain-containing protein [Thalassococcus lentus]
MKQIKSIWDHPFTFWALLSIPAIPMIMGLASGDAKTIHELLHPSGEFAARFMIITMMITPLTMLLKGWRGPRWLMKRRRYLGVAAFGYAALHTVLYLIDEGAVAFTGGELSKLYIWTGWIAFLIFVPLAVTSTDGWVRKLGPAWKSLQRWVYAAAVLTLVHWAALHDWGGIGPAMVHFLPLTLLEIYRFISNRNRRIARAAA